MSSKGKERRVRVLILCGIALLLALVSATAGGRKFWQNLLGASGFSPDTAAPLNIHVIDVGKADAILLQCGEETALLDAGTALGGETVVNYLSRCGVEHLDYVIASHSDQDHIGGMEQVLRQVDTGVFLRSQYHADEYGEIESVLKSRSISQQVLSPGDTLGLGEAVLRVLGPTKDFSDSNNSSLVLRLEYKGFTALFCGDIEAEGEEELLRSGADLSACLLKVPHHGSATSCSKAFLEAVCPQYAVISVGRDNNDLPRESVLRRLTDAGAREIFRTDIDGTIVFGVDGGTMSVQTSLSK